MELTERQKEDLERQYSSERRYYFARAKELPYDLDEELKVVQSIGEEYNASFTIDDTNRFVYENMIKWVRMDNTMQALHPETGKVVHGDVDRGIYIAGGLGTGKTTCLYIMDDYARRIKARYICSAKIEDFTFYPKRAYTIYSEYQQGLQLEDYSKLRVLAVDDLGSEPKELNYMGNKLQPLRTILEERGETPLSRLNVLTSNYPITHKAIAEQYGERVVSRLWAMCNYLVLEGDDRRKSIWQK